MREGQRGSERTWQAREIRGLRASPTAKHKVSWVTGKKNYEPLGHVSLMLPSPLAHVWSVDFEQYLETLKEEKEGSDREALARKDAEEDAQKAKEKKQKAEEDTKNSEEKKKKAEEDARKAKEKKQKAEKDTKNSEEAKKKAEARVKELERLLEAS